MDRFSNIVVCRQRRVQCPCYFDFIPPYLLLYSSLRVCICFIEFHTTSPSPAQLSSTVLFLSAAECRRYIVVRLYGLMMCVCSGFLFDSFVHCIVVLWHLHPPVFWKPSDLFCSRDGEWDCVLVTGRVISPKLCNGQLPVLWWEMILLEISGCIHFFSWTKNESRF